MQRTIWNLVLILATALLLVASANSISPPVNAADPVANVPQADNLPLVVFIHSRECPICAKVRPIVDDLESTYKDKAHFVRLDVTGEKDKDQSRKMAKAMQLGSFFALYEDTFPCVGIFNNKKKCVKELFGNNTKEKYTSFLDKAIQQSN